MRVLAVTGSRADWGLLVPLLNRLRDDPYFDLEVLATGQHLMANSQSLQAVSEDGHKIDWRVDIGLGDDDCPATLARATGAALSGMGAILGRSPTELVLVLGDRYEILATALAAVIARIPIAHLCGGDVTEGAIDDSFRHAITKLSSLHFATNVDSVARIVQMGEDPARVYDVGSTGIDRILTLKQLPRAPFFSAMGFEPCTHNFVITFHPATLSIDPTAEAKAMLLALDKFPEAGLIFTGSNADPGAREIDALVRAYVADRESAVFHASLGSGLYFSALAHCDVVIGNSSSGVMEAPSFRVPTVNIGDRQTRRPRAASVIDCAALPEAVAEAIRAALALNCSTVKNPYGDGHATERIVRVLTSISEVNNLVRKSFVDLLP